MWNQLMPALRMVVLLNILTGMAYPGLVTLVCQIAFPRQANGSFIERDGHVVGSTLIGQNFAAPQHFHPRPSAAGNDGYDASASGGSNLGPTSRKLVDRIRNAKAAAGLSGSIPSDLLTTSASGLDPHISPASARLQIARVAKARNVSESDIAGVVERVTEQRDLGFLGEPRVNVLLLNLALDDRWPVGR